MKFIIFIIALCIIHSFCSCGKSYPDEPTCRKVLILSEKFTREKVYLRTDTSYQDILCGYWLEVFRENKKIWDLDTGFLVCDLNLFEKRIYIIK